MDNLELFPMLFGITFSLSHEGRFAGILRLQRRNAEKGDRGNLNQKEDSEEEEERTGLMRPHPPRNAQQGGVVRNLQ